MQLYSNLRNTQLKLPLNKNDIMKRWGKILIGFIILILVIQIPAFNPKKNISDAEPVNDIANAYDVPMDILMHLYNSCYDCHSNYTKEYPWYYHIQPVSWWMSLHIRNAKKELNFSEFATYSPKKAEKKFHEIQEMMEKKAMPLKSYLLMHDDAKLSNSDYQDVAEWAKKMQNEMGRKKVNGE